MDWIRGLKYPARLLFNESAVSADFLLVSIQWTDWESCSEILMVCGGVKLHPAQGKCRLFVLFLLFTGDVKALHHWYDLHGGKYPAHWFHPGTGGSILEWLLLLGLGEQVCKSVASVQKHTFRVFFQADIWAIDRICTCWKHW